MNELKNCPFCGGEAKYRNNGKWGPVIDGDGAYVDIDIQDAGVFMVECLCGAQIVSDKTEQEVIAAWNRRPEPRPLTLDDLREEGKSGKPVWNGKRQEWNLVHRAWYGTQLRNSKGSIFQLEDAEPIYDRPPGGAG